MPWSGQQLLSFEKVDDLFEALTSVAVRQVEAFTPWAQTVGLLLATHGALALAKARARERSEHLNRALVSNREIGHQPQARRPRGRDRPDSPSSRSGFLEPQQDLTARSGARRGEAARGRAMTPTVRVQQPSMVSGRATTVMPIAAGESPAW